jgi:membrane protein DedA with SNARE-associated domain
VDLINEFILQAAASPWLLLVMFGTAVLDGFLPPVPSETVLVAAASVAASTDDLSTVIWLCGVAWIGAIIGDNLAYAVGRRVGPTRFAWMRRPRIAAVIHRARRALENRGAPLILGARYIPVGRVVVNMSAGALHYPWRRFFPLSVVAGASWAVYSAGIGIVAGQWLKDQPLLSAVLGVGFALVVGVVIDRVTAARRRRSHREGDAAPASPESTPRESARLAG